MNKANTCLENLAAKKRLAKIMKSAKSSLASEDIHRASFNITRATFEFPNPCYMYR